MGPRDPGSGVGRPFGRHAEVSFAGCGHLALLS
jgi:hypothetical protein